MAEKLRESEINRLRQVVGLGSSDSPDVSTVKRDIPPAQPMIRPGDRVEENIAKSPAAKQVEQPNPQPAPIAPIAEKKPAAPGPSSKEKTRDDELFVKIDEHSTVATELKDAKKNVKAVVDTITLLAKAEKLKQEAISKMEQTLDALDAKIASVEDKLMAPADKVMPAFDSIEIDVGDDLSELHTELDTLKQELSRINSE